MREELECLRNPENQHSEHAVSVRFKKNNQRMKFIGHITDALAKVAHGLMSEWRAFQVIVITDGKHRGAQEKT